VSGRRLRGNSVWFQYIVDAISSNVKWSLANTGCLFVELGRSLRTRNYLEMIPSGLLLLISDDLRILKIFYVGWAGWVRFVGSVTLRRVTLRRVTLRRVICVES
jgi:hypothetical protein